MTLLGRAAWWLPGRLNRLLPDLDVDGEKLRHRLDAVPLEPVVSIPERVQA
jgi:RND superfamily putative drug exporter